MATLMNAILYHRWLRETRPSQNYIQFSFLVGYVFQEARNYGACGSLSGSIPLGMAASEHLPERSR